jgi:hypothetical protein
MRARPAGALAVVLSLLTLVPVGGAADVPDSALHPPRLAEATNSPVPQQVLEQKMQQLHINRERYTQISRGAVTIVNETNGRPVGRRRSVSLDARISGEVSMSPPRAEQINVGTGKPIQIEIGSTTYAYSTAIARKHPHRAWVRSKSEIGPSFPYSASPYETSLGGEGSYSQLFNLLATAVGSIGVLGPVVVDGQSATEFTADVEPFRLIQGLTVEDVQSLEKHPVSTTVQIFLSEAGIPVRVVISQSAQHIHSVETTDVTAVEVPISVAPPPARETISVAQARTLEGRRRIVAVSSQAQVRH